MRSQETLMRRHLKRQGITIQQYRIWTGSPDSEGVMDFFKLNPGWDIARLKELIVENRAHIRNLSREQIQKTGSER